MGGMWREHSEQSVHVYISIIHKVDSYYMNYVCVCVCVCVCVSVCECLNLVRANAMVILLWCFAFTFGVFGG